MVHGSPGAFEELITYGEGWVVKEGVMRYGGKTNRPRNHFDRVNCDVLTRYDLTYLTFRVIPTEKGSERDFWINFNF